MAKRVVVVGGGFAGSFIAKQLVKHTDLIDLTLIDTKEFFEHTPSVLREIVTYAVNDGNVESESPSTVLEHSAYLHPKGRLIVGEVVDVSNYDVTVNVIKNVSVGSETSSVVEACSVDYDFLCICTGNNYPTFVKTSAVTVRERHQEYKKQGQALKNAESVLIIGGGPVGVELTAEILQQYPNKEVTLVSSNAALLPNMPPRAQTMAHQYLEFCGTRLFYNQMVNTLQSPGQEPFKLTTRSYIPLHIQNMDEGTVKYTTSKGITGTAEKVYCCSGGNPKTNFMLKHFFSQLDDDFKLKVNDFMQLENCPNIFAAGDITNLKEEKLAERALKQAEVVVENILCLAKGSLAKAQYIMQQNPGLQVVSFGSATGALCMWGEVVSSGRVAAASKEAFLAFHSASLLSNAQMLFSSASMSSGMVVNSAAINHKVAQCSSRIAVLGQGGLSTEVVKFLAKYGTMSVVIVPTGSIVRLSKKIRMKGVQILEWDTSDALLDTLQGVDTVFLTCTVGISMVAECVSFIQACKAAKVKYIVKCTQGAMDADVAHYDLAAWNREIEDALIYSGIPYCIVRHTHFFTTLRIFTERFVKLYRLLAWPLGKQKVAWIDPQDVVLAVCAVIVDPQTHKSQCYTLTGAVWLSAEDIRRELATVVHENIQLVYHSPDFIYQQLVDFGVPPSLADAQVPTHTYEVERNLSSDFLTLTGQLPTSIHSWLRLNYQRFSNTPTRSTSSTQLTPRGSVIPSSQSMTQLNRPMRPIRTDLSRNQIERNKSNTVFPPFRPPPVPEPPQAAIEKLEILEKLEDILPQTEGERRSLSPATSSNLDTDNFIFSGEFQAQMDIRTANAFNTNGKAEAPNSIANTLGATLIVPEGFHGLAFQQGGRFDEDEDGTIKAKSPRSKPPSAQDVLKDVLKPSTSEPTIRPPPEKQPSARANNTFGSLNELASSTASSSSSSSSSPSPLLVPGKISHSGSLPPTSYIPIDSMPRSMSISGIAQFQTSGMLTPNMKHGFLPTPSGAQQPAQSPLIDLGFFDLKFREAFKEHFISCDMARMCPWVDLIMDITKFKCEFEGMPVPSKEAITADIYRQVTTRSKKKTGRPKVKILHEGDPHFKEAKSRAQKILAKYRATNSPNHIPLTGKHREKLSRTITNRVAQDFFDKILTLAWHTLEAELPRFTPSVERQCYEEHKALTQDILRIEHKLSEVDTSMINKQSELQILQQQKMTLGNLLTAKLLATKRHRPKATYLCGYENFSAMSKFWETIPTRPFEFPIPNDLVCYMKGEAGNEKEIIFSDIACGRLTSTYPLTETSIRLGDPICDTFRLYLTHAYGIILMADGCNWGRMPCEAARNASDEFLDYVREHLPSIHTLQRLGQLLIQGVEAAHQAVLAPSKYKLNMASPSEIENWDVGTTTMVAGVVVRTQRDAWEILCVSIGDCKLMVYRDGKVIDVTAGNRGNLTDARDPGGRIGPHMKLGRPDLRNLSLTTFSCMENDLVFAVTDGIHDNFDPQQLGVSPHALGLDTDDWRAAETLFNAASMKKKSEFMTSKMQEAIMKLAHASRSPVTPAIITRALTQYTLDLSYNSRMWMENNPGKKLIEDYSLFPGKMDHATCVCMKVNYRTQAWIR
eukprot:Phypoly_transcript_00336.p1 GENE.Phypoly_transcript_00336~~Phypoly_transcript_00336.p1  ORF type:complete len:1616 (-),score=256.83 Phypoly_transcript_00336:128-4975(-)